MSFQAGGRLPGSFETLRLPIAAAVVLLVGVVALALVPDAAPHRDTAMASPAAPSATPPTPGSPPPDPRPSPSGHALPLPWVALEPGRHDLPFGAAAGTAEAWIRVTVPGGWARSANGTMLQRYPLGGPTLSLSLHSVSRVASDLCDSTAPFIEVGPTIDDLVAALSSINGVSRTGPTDVTIDGRPARRVALAMSNDCPRPERRWIWEDLGSRKFGLLDGGGAASVTVTDLAGTRLVIAVNGRGASTLDVAEMSRIVDSIDIQALAILPTPTARGPSTKFEPAGP